MLKISVNNHPLRKLVLVVLLLLLVFISINNKSIAGGVDGGAVRAAYLLNFIRFTEWPEQTFRQNDATLQLCIIDAKQYAEYLLKLTGKTAEQRTIVVKQIRKPEEIKNCHVLYYPGNDQKTIENIFLASKEKAILTIGENSHFTQSGGLVHIFKENNKLRFNIHFKVLKNSGLIINSRLLKLAKNRHEILGTENHD